MIRGFFFIGKQADPYNFIYDYINWGGFPLRFSFDREGEIKQYLEQTYRGIIDKDIVTEKSRISRQDFNQIADYVMANAGKEFSSRNIEAYFKTENKVDIDKKKIYRYLDKLEKACLINRVKKYNIVGKEAMKYTEKQYVVDSGFRMINTNLINYEDSFFFRKYYL